MKIHKYLTNKHLKGLRRYEYSAIDTSPISKYLMHPTWNFIIKLIPEWVAPNLLTFTGFMCLVTSVVLLSIYDYDCYASGGGPGKITNGKYGVPNWVYTICGVLLFLAYNLDGIDGKQARKIGVSGPLGELFDHGLDSYIVFFIPFCFFSIFGRDEFSVSTFRGYLAVVSVVLNFYVSHCEKYNTGTLYLPWGYDLSMWVSTILFLVAGVYGPGVYKRYVFGDVTFVQALEVAIHGTGLFTTLPVAIYNVYLSYEKRKGKMYPLVEAIRPIWSMLTVTIAMTIWAVKSPNDILEYDPRAFLMLFGTLFSNIACRLIVAEISGHRCELICWLFWPLSIGIFVSLSEAKLEPTILYTLTVVTILAHIHYGVCVVQQICKFYGINCFTVPKTKQK